MNHKGIITLALASALSVSVLTACSFTSAQGAAAKTTAETAQESGQKTVEDNGQKDVSESEMTGSKGRKHGKGNSGNSAEKSARESVEEPENAIGKDSAKEKALADAGVTADQAGKVRARVTKLDDGTVVYKVSFTYNDQHYSYRINALTGEVVDKNTESGR